MSIAFLIGIAAILAVPPFSRSSWMVYLQDDSFYYLKVAQNIAHGYGSTFGGLSPTNGYQPLWLWILTGVSLFTSRPTVMLLFFAFSDLIASVITFLLSKHILEAAGARRLVSFALAALVTLYSLMLFFYGMETTLTVPLLLAVIYVSLEIRKTFQSVRRSVWFGLLLAALGLSRIDSLIFLALAAICLMLSPYRRDCSLRATTAIAIGFLPVPAYFVMNHRLFGTWLPVSGMAKQLRDTHLPSLEPWKVFFHPLAACYALLILSALLLWPRIRSQVPAFWLFPAVLIFPFVYYLILSCVSDWTLWGWYMYPIRTALCVSLATFAVYRPSAAVLQRSAAAWLLVVLAWAGLAMIRWRHQQEDIDAASIEIAHFAREHPGTYAMGDRAGRVGYRIHSPLLQTEGLMMDKDYLENLKQQRPLREVLLKYGVRYYVATAYVPFTGCFQAAEPAKAGPSSHQLRSTFCEPPLATWTHNGIETLVFDVSR